MRVSFLFLCCVLLGATVGLSAVGQLDADLRIARLKDDVRKQQKVALERLRFLCQTHEGLEELDEALHCARRILVLDDSGETDILRMASLCGRLGRPEEGLQALLAHAKDRRASARLGCAIRALAKDAGQDALAAAWEQRIGSPLNNDVSEHARAAAWLGSAGYLDARVQEWQRIIDLQPVSHSAASVHRSMGKQEALARRWSSAAPHYIRAAKLRTELRGGVMDTVSRRDGASGYALRALTKAEQGDDAGSRADIAIAVRWVGGEASPTSSLLWALEMAPPAPWFLEVVGSIAEDKGWANGNAAMEAVCASAERWLAYQHSLPRLQKPRRVLNELALRRLVTTLSGVTWVVTDPYADGRRWIGTEKHFVALDDSAEWTVSWSPELVEELDVDSLRARCIAPTENAVWVGTNHGLFRYDRQSGRWLQYVVGDNPVETSVEALECRGRSLVATLAVSVKKRVWRLNLKKMVWRPEGRLAAIKGFFTRSRRKK